MNDAQGSRRKGRYDGRVSQEGDDMSMSPRNDADANAVAWFSTEAFLDVMDRLDRRGPDYDTGAYVTHEINLACDAMRDAINASLDSFRLIVNG